MGHTLTWEKGRQLKSFDGNTYTYNANGIRTSKTVNGVKHTYTLDGAKILRETWNTTDSDGIESTNVLIPLYDNEDSVCGIVYNNTPYYFLKNLQGDIIAITDQEGTTVARYTYDAWGVCFVADDMSGDNIEDINPFRYRGYYYDAEIGMYYLQSRYYNPALGRFISADGYLATEQNLLNNNLFAYCCNNPVNYTDPKGQSAKDFSATAGQALGEFLYELLTGKEHPNKQVKEMETQIVKKQNDMISAGLEALYDTYMRGYTIQQQSQLQNSKALVDGLKYYRQNPRLALDLVRDMGAASSAVYTIATFSIAGGPTGAIVGGVVAAGWAFYDIGCSIVDMIHDLQAKGA